MVAALVIAFGAAGAAVALRLPLRVAGRPLPAWQRLACGSAGGALAGIVALLLVGLVAGLALLVLGALAVAALLRAGTTAVRRLGRLPDRGE